MGDSKEKHTAHQDISMQLNRLEGILNNLHARLQESFGSEHPTTKQALKGTLYLHALQCDYKVEHSILNVPSVT